MTVKYKTLLTTAGAAKLAAATAGGTLISLTHMAVGDGGGSLPEPDVSQTALIREKWRAALNKISIDVNHDNYVVAELVIPPERGGFWMREMGLFDADGTLIAIANMAESYKPKLAEGSGRAQTVRMVIMVSAIESVDLTIDTTTVMATQDYVDDKLAEHERSRRHPDATLEAKGFTQLSSATDSTSEALAATPKAVKAAYDLANDKYSAQDATTARKGLVQLSSATDSTIEVLAATPKAVKAAYDLANGKYTAQDASTARKGIVQLSSATDSTSEVLAATPKAVKAAYDLANGKYSAQDATTVRKGLVQLSSAADSESEVLAATPKAVKAANHNANGRVPSGRKINGRALSADISLGATDVGALSVGGGRLTGNLEIYSAAPIIQLTEADTGKKYFVVVDGSGLRINEDSTTGNAVLTYASSSKILTSVGQIVPGNYANFDLKYQPKGSYTPAGEAYTKAQSDARYGIVNGLRRGGQQLFNSAFAWIGVWEAPAGCVLTGVRQHGADDGRKMGFYYRQMQYLNKQSGAWVNVGD
ncbi:UNVERIFIED_ORG: phage-related tail fiber protein [Buttiauxella agrestis ATCC 33320]